MKEEQIQDLIDTGEGYHIEFKRTVDKTFIEEVCAFANAAGGTILLGVEDNGEICGVKTDNSFRSQITNTVSQIEPKIDVKLSIMNNVIAVEVPNSPEKPYGCSKGFFMRMGANSQKLTRNEIILFYQSEGRIRFDELLNKKADFEEDFNERAFKLFLEKTGITSNIDKNKLLKNLNCCDENGKLTNTGVMFFARNIEFLIPHGIVTCALYRGTKKIFILDKKDFDDNILENIDNAVAFVMRHINMELKIEHIRRENIPEIPEVALREAIVNAVCHRDYFEKGANVMIEVFDDKVNITNPGGLPSGLKQDEFGEKSVCRNSVFADLLLRADYIERMGTGINRIKDAVSIHGKGTVEFKPTEKFFVTSFSRSSYKGDNTEIEIIEKEELISNKKKEKTSDKILKLMSENPKITASELATVLNLTQRPIEKQIFNLQKNNKLKRNGSDKNGSWEVI